MNKLIKKGLEAILGALMFASLASADDVTTEGRIGYPTGYVRPNCSQTDEEQMAEDENGVTNRKRRWSYGLASRRTGEPLIEEGGEHRIDRSKVSYGYNVVVDYDFTNPQGRNHAQEHNIEVGSGIKMP